jgi:hypothetical protein
MEEADILGSTVFVNYYAMCRAIGCGIAWCPVFVRVGLGFISITSASRQCSGIV